MTQANSADSSIELIVLGSGTSMGVPTPGCPCAVCHSSDPHDKRLRPSVLVNSGDARVVIDTTPDFRTQALRENLLRLDAVVLTHAHADHIMGFDDIRPYSLRQKKPMPVYASAETANTLQRVFAYAFDEAPALSSVPEVDLRLIEGPFEAAGIPFTPVPLEHGNSSVLGFRVESAAYLTDFSRLPESSKSLVTGLDDLILDALRDEPHPMHLTVEQALELVRELRPKRAWFTHIAHELPHAATNERLRRLGFNNVQLAYDGLRIPVRVSLAEAHA
ncbi:MAG TPA: MBL fold metallo-hydrolase [Candidatus Acidoferrales bacterium]|nr:MBL fold metallo-hydrolase [Candidatus Acidoferrales bacterium]